jgi:transcription-repair coupling factor (superfamily II helicase)
LDEKPQSILDFGGAHWTLWIDDFDLIMKSVELQFKDAGKYFRDLTKEEQQDFPPPAQLFCTPSEIHSLFSQKPLAEFGLKPHFSFHKTVLFSQNPQPRFHKNFEMLAKNLHSNQKNRYQCVLFSSQQSQIDRLERIFKDIGAPDLVYSSIFINLHEGFIDQDNHLVCYTDHQIFERYHRFYLKEGFSKNKQALTIKELNSLKKGDFVVHIDHGIGTFSGLESIEVHGKMQEAIRLKYKDNDVLYVSIHSLHRISKYSGKEGTVPKVHKLGSQTWQKLKSKTKKRIRELAYDLLRLYAKRQSSKGFAFSPDTYLQTELEASFLFEDTPDQYEATQVIKKDMERDIPMDRLVCGDVGFGKTELAIRAAFKAATDGKQAAVLVPTTVLSFQHFKTFSSRLEEFPVKVDYINRFKTGKRLSQTLLDLKEGKTDIIIGTHKLLNKSVKFKDLGLMIVDEEQKFGVAIKDKLKLLKANIDTLTLTATPIPRTLQFSLMGARDLSLLNTPPPNRYPVQTELMAFNEAHIREVISYEISRGGQVFFINNRIQNLEEVAEMIRRQVPKASVITGHGQMPGNELEKVMLGFMEGEFDVLVSTTIVESGLDIPNANTMLINDAQKFGLSDLHQLRGRVGRSNRKAFCYLITPPLHMINDDSRKRIRALLQFSELGSGMNIAMRDLDIRGAGDLFGAEQSGFISEIGFEMYQKILKEAIHELKQESIGRTNGETSMDDEKEFVADCVIETDLEILIPNTYVNEIEERIALYKTLDEIEHEKDLQVFIHQMNDRFGKPPKPLLDLFNTLRLRWLAKSLGFEKVILKSGKLIGTFVTNQDSPFYQSSVFSKILRHIQSNPPGVKMYERKDQLKLSIDGITTVQTAINYLNELQGEGVASE